MNNFFKNQMNYDGRTTVERRSNNGQSQGHYTLGLTKLIFTLTLLLTLAVGQMWASTTFADGDVLFYDFSDVTGGGGVNWQCNGNTMVYDPSGAGTIKCVIFTSSTTWTTSWTIAKTAKGSWANINMPSDRPSGKNCIKIGSDGKTASWTTISLAEKVAKGDLIMVYGGELSSWRQSNYYFIGSNSNTTDNTKALANANKSITINSEAYKFGPVALPSGTYIQGHWASNLSCSIAAGSAYVVRGSGASTTYFTQKANSGSDYLYQVKKQDATSPTTSLSPTCPASIDAGSKLSFSHGAAGVSVLGRTNSVKYYLKNGSTYTEKTLSDGKIDVSDLAEGDYSIITLLYDGYIYVKASTSNFSVVTPASYSLTVEAGAHISTVTGSTDPITLGNSYSISASGFDTGYEFDNWTADPAGNASFVSSTSASTSVTVSNGSVTVTANAKEKKHDVTVYYKCGSTTIKTATTETSVGTSTPRSITAPDIDGYTFSSWTKGSGITIKSGTTSTATISITSGASGNTLQANYTAKACNLYKFNAAKNGTGSSVGSMTFDVSTLAYYKDITTNSSPYYFRFNFNSGTYYSTDWSAKTGTEAYTKGKTIVANGEKVDCNQNVTSWDDKPSIVFNGLNSSAIRIWFDYQNKKVWITETTYTVTVNNGDHGTVSPNGSQSVGKNSGISITASPSTGYNFTSWSKTGSAVLSSTTANPTTVTATGTGTVTATYTAKQYTITLDNNGGEGGTSSVKATYNSSTLSTAITNPTRTGYTFNGWHKTNGSGQLIINTGGALQAGTDYTGAGGIWTNDGAVTLYAGWTPKTTIVSFSQSGTGYGSGGQSTTKTATYDAAMPTPITCPTAANGYAFMGYFGDEGGEGTQYYNADGSSAHNWDQEGATATLYAYFKKAEITALTFDATAVAPSGTVGVTPTIDPTPQPTTIICWHVMHSNGNLLSPQPDITWDGTKASFTAPTATGNYKVAAVLRTGSACNAGTVLDSITGTFSVGGNHIITILYKCDNVSIKASDTVHVAALGTKSVTAPTVFGYTFDHWVLGDGVSSAGSTSTSPITISAIYDGTLTAVYTKKSIFYFKNTLGWEEVYVNFMSNQYWDGLKGSGNQNNYYSRNNAMSLVPGTTDIYYIEYTGSTSQYITFTSKSQDNAQNFWGKNPNVQVVVPTRPNDNGSPQTDFGYHAGTNMFVPLNTKVQTKNTGNGGGADYYDRGYWMVYDPITGYTGYTLEVYNKTNDDGGRYIVKEIPFTINSDGILQAVVDLEATTGYGIKFRRDNDMRYTNVSQTLTNDTERKFEYHPDNWAACGIQSTAAGDYIFTINCSSSDGFLYLKAHFPAAVGDFQVYYKDNSKPAHPSRMITASANGVDTISFFVDKTKSPMLKARKVKSINAGTGVITWEELKINGASSKSLSVDSSYVYTFIVTQGATAGTIASIDNIGAYNGNYYIRCDAVSSKWDFYRSDFDHKMTYSAFSESDANKFGEKFSHYKAKWCPYGTNIKFVIANDYSPCISDTLIKDDPFLNNMDEYGTLKDDGGRPDINNRYSANIRFMWNRHTNKVSRAYVGSSTNTSRLFLVLQGDHELHGEDDEATSDEGLTYGVILEDKQNWMYEKRLKILPGSRFKLFASYALKTPSRMDSVQFFCGEYEAGDYRSWTDAKTVELIGGDGDYQLARVLYDFKTNRLVCAWLPSNTAISGELDINADVMVIREHQEDASMITFANNEAKLTEVKTVYGVMKFNRWTLNNKSSAEGHAVLPPANQKSIYERALYFISFPFDVNLSDVFGFGQYGVHWIIENYDGENRAKNGYWTDSPPNWKYVMNPDGYILKANKGYILCLDLDMMKDDDNTFWLHDIQTVELFFPSTTPMETIKQTNCTIPAPDPAIYQCTINRPGPDGDRRIKDSYWRCLGVPSFANYKTTLSDGTRTIAWQTSDNTLPFLYEWNMDDNSLSPQSTSTFEFKTMHAYLTQCSTQIIWSATSSKPLAPRRSDSEMLKDREFRLQLDENGVKKDHAFVRLSMDETVTADFEFGNDMSKELNSGRSNIYTLIGYERAAANSLPLSTEQTTIIPVGVLTNTAGDYTFSMPDGTDGIGITLVDSETGIRTQLGALDYTVTLDKGTYDERFYLEISPIHNTPTDLGGVNSNQPSAVRKVIIDQNMYIIRDGKMYNVQGARCN